MDTSDVRKCLQTVVAGSCVLLSALGCKGEKQRPGASVGARPSSGSAVLATVEGEAPTASPGDPRPLTVVFNERGTGVAYVLGRAGKLRVVHNGRAGREVRAVDLIALSPDGTRIAYSADVEGTWRMVVDDALPVASISVGEPVFSPDGRHVAYAANRPDGSRMIIDALETPVAREIVGAPAFSADSRRVAYVAVPAEGQPRLMIADVSSGGARVKCSGVKGFLANEARTRIAAIVEDEDEQQRVIAFDFSEDGPASRGPAYDAASGLAFGGGSLAYVGERGGRRFLVLDGREEALPDGSTAGAPVIRPDGKGAGVLVSLKDGVALHEAFVPPGGTPRSRYEEAAELAYGEGGRSAYCARRGESWFVVVNGKEGPPFDRVVTPSFSPDGKHLAYRARKDGKRFVVVADTEGRTVRQHPEYEQVFPVRFTADGRSIAYGVKDGRQLAWKVEAL